MTIEMAEHLLVDALRTVAVNGAYNASRALSKWLRRGVRLTSDGFKRLPMAEASSILGDPESVIAAVHMPLAGDVGGHLLLAFPSPVALSLADLLLEQPEGTAKVFEELERSCLQETGNIVGTAYANSLARWLKLRIAPSVPEFAQDMACAIIDPLIMELVATHDEVFVAATDFLLDGRHLEWALLLLPSMDSLERMRKSCEQDVVRQQALQTIAINGAFNASRAMSKWVRRGVRISTDGFTRVPLADTANQFDENVPLVALHLPLSEQMHGHALLALSQVDALRLVDMLVGQPAGTASELGEIERSALAETGNIVASSFVNSWSAWLDICVEPASPELVVDLPGAVFDSMVAEQVRTADEVFMARTDFTMDDESMQMVFLLLPSPAAMRLIETACQ